MSSVLIIVQALPNISFSKDTLWFDKNNGNQTISVTSDFTNWEVDNINSTWCTYSNSGNNLTIRVNATNEDRKTTIKFKGYTQSVTVIQSKYSVGDDYNEGGVSAKVAYMQDELRLVSCEVGKSAWSTEYVATGTNNFDDGRKNMAIIQSIPNWKDIYPAFALCDKLNTQGVVEWYLPAYYELQKVPSSDNAWSSTEYNSSDMVGDNKNSAYTKWETKWSEYWFTNSNKKNVFCIVAVKRF